MELSQCAACFAGVRDSGSLFHTVMSLASLGTFYTVVNM